MYTIDFAREEITDLIEGAFKPHNLPIRIDMPSAQLGADFAVPIFELAKQRGERPDVLAQVMADELSQIITANFSVITAKGGFVNFTLDKERFASNVVEEHCASGDAYGSSDEGSGRTIVIDYSAPNIAKPFSVGHLRSTVIGQALHNIFSFLGYTVVGDNHIGDWGTQFGKLMAAYKHWGNRDVVNANPIKELLELYVQFGKEAKIDPGLNDEGRAWFKRLEDGDPEAVELWKWFGELSWIEFTRVYELLGVSFDETLGESFYNDKLAGIVQHALDSGVAVWDNVQQSDLEAAEDIPTTQAPAIQSGAATKAVIIPAATLSAGLPEKERFEKPALIQKSDGASLYITRDLATIEYRTERWNPEQIIYVVGGEQQLYFRELFRAAKLLGFTAHCVHTWFGMVRLPEGKMSTREGRVIFLDDVLAESISKASALLEGRDMGEDEKLRIAHTIGVGAIKYGDLSQNRTRDIVFDWKRMLSMDGDSAPYLQYAYVRIQSILRKTEVPDMKHIRGRALVHDAEHALVKKIALFPDSVRKAAAQHLPHVIANYAFELAQVFSTFYTNVQILKTESIVLRATRIYLCMMTAEVLKRALGLLGIDCPEQM